MFDVTGPLRSLPCVLRDGR